MGKQLFRKSPRLRSFDYSTDGTYFVTICVQNMELRFGAVVDQALQMNVAGEMVATVWQSNVLRYPGFELDSFIVMPNHIHGIVHIGSDPTKTADSASLIDFVQTFKSLTTLEYARGVRESGYPPYDRALWQRSFYDRILRDQQSLDAARQYIENNPERWLQRRDEYS